MLQYAPAKRITAAAALKHPYFESYLKEKEEEAKKKSSSSNSASASTAKKDEKSNRHG